MASLEIRDVTKTFRESGQIVEAVRGVSLDVDAGEMISLVGPSGSGKSTLLAMVGALLTPTSGSIVVDGKDIAQFSPGQRTRFRRDRVGFVFQGSNMVPFLTARENLLVVGEFGGTNRKALNDRADELLKELGLTSVAGQIATRLSGGERQRVAIARALMRDPLLLLVDEPTASLNTDLGSQVVESLANEVHRHHKACLMVTHDPRMAEQADRIVSLRDGMLDSDEKAA